MRELSSLLAKEAGLCKCTVAKSYIKAAIWVRSIISELDFSIRFIG